MLKINTKSMHNESMHSSFMPLHEWYSNLRIFYLKIMCVLYVINNIDKFFAHYLEKHLL